MKRIAPALALFALAGCADGHRVEQLRSALADAKISLADSVDVAATQTQATKAVRAELKVGGDPVFSVGTLVERSTKNVKVDIESGDVLSVSSSDHGAASCDGQISLVEAIQIAEQRAGGDGVAVVPDDDVACAFEIQVLADKLMEVKVASNGDVLEYEVSDENED